ncbi:glycosyltransferase family 4 protein [Bacillus wiedmannii]|uniref:glycosyltransferase family 4 protein n=1 Tax=Bacillus wiedmannii TaxID=1890302 RepID=UPI000BF0E68E|nr:glycosyltransferase family 4 protein [Bacillus wiedmannii]PEO38849.1 hypothetical protein CN555_11295 [Bacillus wiedmannii]
MSGKKLKILYIHQYFATRESATGTRSYEFARLLVKKGHDVTVLTGTSQLEHITKHQKKNREEYKIDDIKVIAIKNEYSNYFSKWKRIQSFINFLVQASIQKVDRNEYDVIFATSTPLTVAIPALFLHWRTKIPFVFEVRDLWPEAPLQLGHIKSTGVIRILRWLERFTYQKATKIVALSPGMVKGIQQTGVSADKIVCIPNSSDVTLFQQKNLEISRLKKKYNVDEKFVVVHGGSTGEINGLDYVIQAAKLLKGVKEDNIVFLMTGDGGHRPHLERECQMNNLKNVIFMGKVPRNTMPEILALADVTLTSVKDVPILQTSSPNKFFDALAAKKPIIVNCDGWMKEMLLQKNAGFYVDPKKPKDLAMLLGKIQFAPEDLIQKGNHAYQLAVNEFDRRLLVEKLEKVLLDSV